jgi:hypothetical protein
MRAKFLMTSWYSAVGLALLALMCAAQDPATTSLEQRLRRGDSDAYREVERDKRLDMVPTLEELANRPNSGVSPEIALGRLGVKKYLDRIIEEMIAPTNSATYARYRKGLYKNDPSLAELKTIQFACDKLGLIKDKSTVKYLIQMLDYKGDLMDRVRAHGQFVTRPQTMAGTALWEMHLENAPTNMPFRVDEGFIKAWKQWWEQNKDKYP